MHTSLVLVFFWQLRRFSHQIVLHFRFNSFMAIRDFLGESTNNLVSVLYIELINSHERGQKESHSVGGGLEMVPANPLRCLSSMQ